MIIAFMKFLHEFLVNRKLVKRSNNTFIASVLKKENPHSLNDFRMISLVGCMYKMLAMILENRLKSILAKVISKTHTIFMKGKQFFDRILIANEVVDDKKKRLKLYFSRVTLRRHVI